MKAPGPLEASGASPLPGLPPRPSPKFRPLEHLPFGTGVWAQHPCDSGHEAFPARIPNFPGC